MNEYPTESKEGRVKQGKKKLEEADSVWFVDLLIEVFLRPECVFDRLALHPCASLGHPGRGEGTEVRPASHSCSSST